MAITFLVCFITVIMKWPNKAFGKIFLSHEMDNWYYKEKFKKRCFKFHIYLYQFICNIGGKESSY